MYIPQVLLTDNTSRELNCEKKEQNFFKDVMCKFFIQAFMNKGSQHCWLLYIKQISVKIRYMLEKTPNEL